MNIQGTCDIIDPFYRYKMHKLNIVHQKHKTIIDNIEQVCVDLKVSSDLLYKFFKSRFSVSMNLSNQVLSTSAKISYSEFEQALREFIEIYILCKSCKLPELEISCQKNGITRKCTSCSFSDYIKK